MGTNKLALYRNFFILIVLIAILASSAFFFFPEVKAVGAGPALAIAFASSLSQLAAAAYFFAGLRDFKPALKRAYSFLALGIILFSLAQLVPSLSAFTDILSRNTTVASAFIVVPYFAGAMGMYWGIRTFARTLGVSTFWNSALYTFLCALVAACAVAFAPHPVLPVSDTIYRTIFSPIGWCLALSTITLVITIQIHRVISDIYKPAMRWLALALGALSFTALHEFVVKIYFTTSSYAFSSLSVWPFLVVAVLFLLAGISFHAVGRESLRFPPNPTFVDVVMGVCSLVSKPQDVDRILDDVRVVTSTNDISQLSPEDQSTLLRVYLSLEQYLTTSERLHTYTVEGLREYLPSNFLQALKNIEQPTPPVS